MPDSQIKPRAYRARWIVPVTSEPIENGTIEIDRSGHIVGLDRGPARGAVDLGEVALIPGLVNAHTHLEFSNLNRPLEPGQPFDRWIRALVSHRQSRSEPLERVLARGLEESATAGTTLLGEIATIDLPTDVYRTGGPGVVVFRELIGFRSEQIEAQVQVARRHLEGSRKAHDVALRGISPHAPYSVHPELYSRLVDLAAEHRAPLAVHLAETRAELDLLDRAGGPLVKMLKEFGVWQQGAIRPGSRPLDYLRPLATLDCALVIHGNYLGKEDLDFIAAHENISLVYCPRTHAYFGHAVHPWRTLQQRGGRVALGTDSRASNPDLSLWKELLFLHERHRDVSPALLLQLATSNGARAFGLQGGTGSLAVGKRADVAVVSLSRGGDDPYSLLFESNNRLLGTMRGGAWVYRQASLPENCN